MYQLIIAAGYDEFDVTLDVNEITITTLFSTLNTGETV